LAERSRTGSMGKGWATLADIGISTDSNGTIVVTGLIDPEVLKSLDASLTAQYAVSLSVDKIIGLDGRILEGEGFIRPTFTSSHRVDGNVALYSSFGQYQMKTNDGDQYNFDYQTGKLISFISKSGEEISVIYDTEGRIERYQN